MVETLRPLRADPLSGVPPFVRGVAVIRGEPIPVVDLEGLLSGERSRDPARWVVLRVGDRRAALAVDEVLGVGSVVGDAPAPLLAGACSATIEALAARDRELLVLLEASRLVPEEAWRALAAQERGA